MARRWAAAEDDADLALALEPAHVKARHSRGQARAALGFKRPALADLTHVLRAAPHAEPVRASGVSTRASQVLRSVFFVYPEVFLRIDYRLKVFSFFVNRD